MKEVVEEEEDVDDKCLLPRKRSVWAHQSPRVGGGENSCVEMLGRVVCLQSLEKS